MANTKPPGNLPGLPEGYSAVPIREADAAASLRLCVLARATPDPVGGHLLVLRDLPESTVYLGCLTDAAGRLHGWAELWVQNADGLAGSLPALRESCSNRSLDERWAGNLKSISLLDPDAFVQTGWEAAGALPIFLDLGLGRPVHPDKDGLWQLCREDALLEAAGLPPYSSSLFRYLHRPSRKEDGFIPVVSGAPVNGATHPLSEAIAEGSFLIPLNAQGGFVMAREFVPLSYEDYVDLLGGKSWKGMEHGKRLLQFGGVYSQLADSTQMQQSGAHLFLSGQGRAGRFAEIFHLKLQILLDAVSAVRQFVHQQQLPFLNLTADSFRVALKDVGKRLPFLWTAKAAVAKPSQAFALPIEGSEYSYFIRLRPGGLSIYQPEGLNVALQGTASVRIRKVLPSDQNRTTLEGTLVLQERLNASPNDLLWIRLPLPTGRVDLYGHLSPEGLAHGEGRFRTLPQVLSAEAVAALKGAEGVSFARSPFEIVPLLSTPCDLYALGVLAARTFLVNPQNSLPEALDELLALARQAGAQGQEKPLAKRIGDIFNSDQRFANSLGPHRLMQEAIEPGAALSLLPPELWHQLLAAITRFFPGVSPDSYCKDFGDTPALAIETVFDLPLEELDKLLVRSRSLVVIDWNANREVHSAVRDLADRYSK